MTVAKLEMRDVFIEMLYHRAKVDADIVFLSADYGAPALDRFRNDLPSQFINSGISEQNQISVASGLAMGGKKVFVYSIASFITTRCFEQLKIDLCSMRLPVTIIGVGSCYAYDVDGPTHHATEDIALMRALSHMQIYSPAEATTVAALVDVALNSKTPLYCRFDRGKLPLIYENGHDFSIGLSVLKEGHDIAILATGIMVHRALEVARELQKQGIDAMVVDVYRLKPLNIDVLKRILADVPRLITIEEHTSNGGLGSMMAEFLVDTDLIRPLKRLAITDGQLYAYGERAILHRERGLGTEQIRNTIIKWL